MAVRRLLGLGLVAVMGVALPACSDDGSGDADPMAEDAGSGGGGQGDGLDQASIEADSPQDVTDGVVVVAEVTLPDAGFVGVMQRDPNVTEGVSSEPVGSSELLPAGTHADIEIAVTLRTTGALAVRPYRDDGDQTWNFVRDQTYHPERTILEDVEVIVELAP